MIRAWRRDRAAWASLRRNDVLDAAGGMAGQLQRTCALRSGLVPPGGARMSAGKAQPFAKNQLFG
jgi:hypothetical protein